MNTGYSLKKFYLAIFLISFALSVSVYVYFATETPVYAARGKFSYFFNTSTNTTITAPFTSDPFTKSISDSIQTRSFLAKLYQAAGVKFDSAQAEKPSKFISSSVVVGSNVVQVTIFSTNKEDLSKLSLKFVSVLNDSSIISETVPKPNINITEPIYTDPDPTYPKPFEYAGLTLIGTLLVGIMFFYIFSNDQSS